MTRRDAVKLLSILPAVGLLSSRLSAAAEPASVALRWDWEPGAGEPINYLEVFVTPGDVVPSEGNSRVIRVQRDVRRCLVTLPNGSGPCKVRVRAANTHGVSAFTAPILLSA